MRNIQKKLIFTEQKYYEGGGKASKLLAYKLKKQQAENSIYNIKNPTTPLIHHKLEDILNSFEMYFQRLFSQPHVDGEKNGRFLPEYSSS